VRTDHGGAKALGRARPQGALFIGKTAPRPCLGQCEGAPRGCIVSKLHRRVNLVTPMNSEKRKMARPTYTPGLRIRDPDLYQHLLKSAASSNRSLNEEMILRLVESVERETKA
jgi:hypothetical protein